MSLRLAVDQLRRVSTDVWEAILSPDDLCMLDSPALREGSTSVLIIKNPTAITDNRLEFRADYARVLNLGDTSRTIIIVITEEDAEGPPSPELDNLISGRSPFET